MKKRILASLLSLCLIVGLLPTAALAADESGTEGEMPAVCTCTALCTEGSVDETCPVCAEDDTLCAYTAPAEPGDEPVEEPTEGPAGEPNPCALTEGCTLENGHEGACVLADEPQEPVGPTMEEQLAELIAALPDPADIDPLNEEQVAAVNGQISEIYAFAEENGLDVENDETINAVIAALYPVELLADEEGTQENPWDISAEGAENHVIAYLEKNSGDQSTPTYTLVISGSGAMADFTTNPDYQPWKDQRANITALVVADGVTYLGNRAFQNCSSIKTVSLPTSLTVLGTHVFKACSALESLDLSNIVSFGKEAFVNCSGLTQLTMPTTLAISEIPGAAFSGLSNVQSDIVIPAGVTSIGASAFVNWGSKNENAVAIQWNESVKTVGDSAFQGAKIDEALQIPASVETLGTKAFWKTGITSLFFGDGSELTTIGELSFSECSSLTGSVTIPAKVTEIGKQAFMKTGITGLSFADHSALTEIGEQAFYQTASLTGQITLPDSVKTIGSLAFSESGITGLTISENSKLSSIGESAFAKCASLGGTIYIPGGVSQVGKLAFSNISLTKLILAEGVKTIGEHAFTCDVQQDSLHTVIFPSTLTSIGEHAFYNSASIHGMYFPSWPGTVGNSAFYGVPNTCIVYYQGTVPTGDELNSKTIAYTNGGTFAEDTDFMAETLATPTKEGYIFAGWYGNAQFTGDKATTATAGQTYYAKWIELTSADITMEYGSEKALSEIKIEGVALTGWTSANSDVARIEGDKLIATGVGKTTITADAGLARSGEKLTVDVTVTPMPITFGTEDGENPGGQFAYDFTGKAPEFSMFAKFYPAKVDGGKVSVVEGSKAVALTEGKDIVFVYNAGAGEQEYEYLPIDVTDSEGISVTIKLVNPNYRFVTESAPTQSDSIKETVIVQAEGKTEVPIMGVPAAGETMTYPYNGQPQPPVSNLTRMSAGSIDKFTVHFHPWGDTEFKETHLENASIADLTPEAIRAIAPTEPGSYLMIVDGVSDTEYAYRSWIFTITKATVTIRPNDKSAYVGDELPTLGADDYTVTGLVGKDTLSTKPTLAYEGTPDMSKAGTYGIKAGGAAANEAHYTLAYEDGTLTVSRRSSGGGGGSSSGNTTTETEKNPDGSTTTTVTDKKTGTVTETTKFKDGSTLVVETKKDGTVTTTETAKNGVKVRTVEEPGEDVTAKVTIPKSVGEAVVTIPADVDYGMVAVDADTGEVVKLSVPTREGMTVKLDGSADLVLVDRSRDFTDTRGHWAEDAIDFATAHELFSGTSDTTFAPDSTMTRAMLMTVLARFDGQDTTGGAVWYEKAMAWAKENGISDGSNPDGSITREQLATMLWRYAGSPTGNGSAIGRFTDSGKVSSYAVEAMNWAVGTGLFGGMGDGTLAPQGSATRAQVATILMRFVENLTK